MKRGVPGPHTEKPPAIADGGEEGRTHCKRIIAGSRSPYKQLMGRWRLPNISPDIFTRPSQSAMMAMCGAPLRANPV
jgi:hypothetical protein